MVVDTSALLAILLVEQEWQQFAQIISEAPTRLISSVSVLEAGMVASGRGGKMGQSKLDQLLAELDATIVPFDADQAAVAVTAFATFGKGRHPARLNLGDCAAYALSKTTGEPLLFKGNDFALTDVARCL